MANDTIIVQQPAPVIINVVPNLPLPSGGSSFYEHHQVTPAGTWTVVLPGWFVHKPNVAVYVSDGAGNYQEYLPDVTLTPTNIAITFASPTSGYAMFT